MVKSIIIFAPHPDDETLACGGIIIKNICEGHDVYIVFMTDGRNSHLQSFGIEKDPSPEELVGIRKSEAIKATNCLGIKSENLLFLRIEDRNLEQNRTFAIDLIRKAISHIQPDEIYYPDKSDRHIDHRATFEIIEESLRVLNKNYEVFRYIIWPNKKININNCKKVKLDIRDFLSYKVRAIHQYKSQISLISNQQTRAVLTKSFLSAFLTGYETFLI